MLHTPDPPHPPTSDDTAAARTGWLIAALLVASLMLMAWLVHRQATMLDGHVAYRARYGSWAAYQLQAEALRLESAVMHHLERPGTESLEALSLRVEILASRVSVVAQSEPFSSATASEPPPPVLAQLQDLVAQADAALALEQTEPDAATRLTRDRATRSWQQIRRLLSNQHEPLQMLTLSALHESTSNQEARRTTLDQHRRLVAGLAALQALLLLAMAGVAAWQRRLLRQRHQLQRLADERQAAQREAEAATQAKSRFVANISHELRTPFQGVLGLMGLLADSGLSNRQAAWVHTAQRSARHLLGLLNDILDLSKADAGRLTLRPDAVPLRPLLRDVHQLMQPLAQAKGLLLVLEAPSDLPDQAWLDSSRLLQILYNLLGNAIKFTRQGQVSMRLCRQRGTDGAERLLVQVQDTGPGIDADTLQQLFSRYAQGDAGAARQHDSSGLGLEISRTLARLMGGDITVASQPGQGACFTLDLPLTIPAVDACAASSGASAAAAEAAQLSQALAADGLGTAQAALGLAAAEADAATSPTALEPASPAADPPLSPRSSPCAGMRVLVSEDHAINRHVLGAMLANWRVDTVFCDNGLQATRAAAAGGFDLVLLDLHTPEMDGVQATREIRRLPAPHGQVPIVAVTADVFDSTRARTAEAGMNGFLPKPVMPEDLLAVLRQFGPSPAELAERAGRRVSAPPPLPPTDELRVLRPASAPPVRADSPLDSAALARLCRSLSPSRYLAIASRLLDDEHGYLIRLQRALVRRDAAAVAREAQALAGAADSLALTDLARWAAALHAQAGQRPAIGQDEPSQDEVSGQLAELSLRLDDARAAIARQPLLVSARTPTARRALAA